LNTLSIVIIARNEAKNIARAIESVLVAVRSHPDSEILLVDSASTDATVEIAKKYPINIVRLAPTWFLSVPAGRHIGMCYTSGELVLHMDGDMELDAEWVNRSVLYLLEHPEVGAVGGYYRNIYTDKGRVIGEQDIHRGPSTRVIEARYVGGAALYRRSAIQAMGGFQPYIKGEEGVYMSMGIRDAGFKVVQLPYIMSKHYCVPPHSLAYSLRRLRLDMWLGFGQIPRYYWGTRLFWKYLTERGAFVIYLLVLLISMLTMSISIITGDFLYFGVCLFIVFLYLMVFIIKKRSIRKSMISLIAHTGIMISAVRGFMIKPRSSAEYPTDVEIVKVL
jgi:glycosyltransferase involved in cell wall biosynthesis